MFILPFIIVIAAATVAAGIYFDRAIDRAREAQLKSDAHMEAAHEFAADAAASLSSEHTDQQTAAAQAAAQAAQQQLQIAAQATVDASSKVKSERDMAITTWTGILTLALQDQIKAFAVLMLARNRAKWDLEHREEAAAELAHAEAGYNAVTASVAAARLQLTSLGART